MNYKHMLDRPEMAAVMRKVVEIDGRQHCNEQEQIFRLEQENKGLREILYIALEPLLNLRKGEVSEKFIFVSISDQS